VLCAICGPSPQEPWSSVQGRTRQHPRMFVEGRRGQGQAACDPGCRGKQRRWKGHTRVVWWLQWHRSWEWLPRSIFPGFSSHGSDCSSRSVMKTSNYRAASGWERPDLLFSLPRYTESSLGQCRKRAPLPHPATVARSSHQEGEGGWPGACASAGSEGSHPPTLSTLWGHSADTMMSLGPTSPSSRTEWEPELGLDLGRGLSEWELVMLS
jgi:hypothetical protein